ncbi:IS1-like element transposase [Erwinia sorbitola]|uniref:IS1 family transposase n=1 Tax=Erwinia sorbitola TaxID=2681984 RepID=A0A6I6EYQ2_9GAMM|nr:IS1-like element transposase [Erwinia sorbitola]MTD27987.1 hypothetical protein [Erwinia sorbitola]QGU89802.1 hypothetical protein GN242_21305 [Erwinia sorbitola]
MSTGNVVCPRCNENSRIRRNGRSTSGMQRYRCQLCLKTFQLDFYYLGSCPDVRQTILEMTKGGSEYKDTARTLGISLKTVIRQLKNSRYKVN